jgi:hypothetical protein
MTAVGVAFRVGSCGLILPDAEPASSPTIPIGGEGNGAKERVASCTDDVVRERAESPQSVRTVARRCTLDAGSDGRALAVRAAFGLA